MSASALALVGRATLLHRLRGLVMRGRSVLLRGPAGVGKTRLVAEVCREPGVAGRPLDRLLGNAGGAAVHLSTLAPLGLPDVVSPDDIAAVHSHFLRRWRERAAPGTPALVWLDDAQHVDPLSAAILRQAVVTGVIQLLGTHRATEPLGESMTALHTEALAELVEVPPLDRRAANRLAREASATELRSSVLDRVHALAAGNPLFIRELARALGEGDDSFAPTRLDMIVGRPVTTLPTGCRHALELVAVAEPAPERLLAPYLDDLRELRRRGLVQRQGEHDLRVDHPLRRAWVLSELGAGRTALVRQLLDLVDSQGLAADIDQVSLIDWELQAGRSPAPDRLQLATRRAIARLDGPTSLRFAAAMTSPARELLHGEALVISGRLGEGLDALAEVARVGPVERQVEAAYWQARYLGVMLGDYPLAEAALDAVDTPSLPVSARRLVFAGRLWLWIFGPISDPDALESTSALLDAAPPDEAAFEVAMAAASLTYQVRSPEHAAELMARLRPMQHSLALRDEAVCRASTVQGWWHMARGDAPAGIRAMHEGVAIARKSGNVESLSLLAGSAGVLVAQTGRIAEALVLSGMASTLTDTTDWFQYQRLDDAVHLGNLCLAGRATEVVRLPDQPAPGAVQRHPDLYSLFLARARHLHQQASGQPPDDLALLHTLELLAGNRKHLWVALIGSEITSLSTDPAVHRLLWESSSQVDGPGLVSVVALASRARLDQDMVGLLQAGHDLERSGMASAASRVMADVATQAPAGTPEGQAARASLLRLRRAWDGGPMWWLDPVHDLPSARQMEIAWRVVDGVPTSDIATELYLSRRTVENHMHRAYRALRVTGRDELADLLRLPGAV